MLSLPIEVDSVLRLNVSQQIREVYPDGYITSCWRKYIATWKMEEEKLYLEDIMICPLEPLFYIPLDSVFAPYKDEQGRILAFWFTGTLRVVKGKQIRYNHMGFDRNYEIETLYQVQNGNVIGEKTYHNAHRKSTLRELCKIIIFSFSNFLYAYYLKILSFYIKNFLKESCRGLFSPLLSLFERIGHNYPGGSL